MAIYVNGISDSIKLFEQQDAEATVLVLDEDRNLMDVIATNHEGLQAATQGINSDWPIVLVERVESLNIDTRKKLLISPRSVNNYLLDHLLVNKEGKYASAMCTSTSCCPEEGK